jgi:hypothetical protein
VIVTGAPGCGDAGGQGGSSLFCAPGPGKVLSVLEVGGDVVGMRSQQSLELLVGSAGIARVGALHCQTVTRERIIRFSGDKFFEHLAARFLLWLGHGLEARIIVALGANTKSAPGRTDTLGCPARRCYDMGGQPRVRLCACMFVEESAAKAGLILQMLCRG